MNRLQSVAIIVLICCLCTYNAHAQNDETPTPQWRPVYHFTPVKNWTNDPNGPIFLNGKYQLYNQQNPFGNKWGHMSWGHATSTDLVHWDHLPLAMPETIDKDTNWRFSGSAVNDKNNTSGLCHTPDCLVAIYTLHQPNLKKESQAIAYSNDGGMSFINYTANPVIDLQKRDFRDPSVSWNQQLQRWVMVVVLPSEHKALFYGSADLKKWDSLGEFGNAGYRGSNWECPSLIQLPVEGKPGVLKWVLFISAAGPKNGFYMQYFVGEFDGRNFKNENPAETVLTVDNGDSYYAAIPWNNQPDGKEIMIGWMAPGNKQSTYPWRGQMSISRDLSLRETPDGLRLVQLPTDVIERNLTGLSGGKEIIKSELKVDGPDLLITNLTGNAYWLDAKISCVPGSDIQFKIGQKKSAAGEILSETVVGYNAETGECYVDKHRAGMTEMNRPQKRDTAMLQGKATEIRIQILFDKSSLEVFFANGEKVISSYIFPDADANGISVVATKGKATIRSLHIWDLSGVKNN